MKHINIRKGVDLRIIDEPKFKTNQISVFFNLPMTRENVTKQALLPAVLKRGTEKYPTLTLISRQLDNMYGAGFKTGVRRKGDGEAMYFTITYVRDRFTGTNLTAEVLDFLREFIFNPLILGGGFKQEYLDNEKENLKQAIEGLINDKREYVDVKCRESMFKDQPYGMYEAGYVEDLDGITAKNLYEFYQKTLSDSKTDIFATGEFDDETLKLIEAFAEEFPERDAEYVKTAPAIPDIEKTEPHIITEEFPVAQSKFTIGLRCGVDPVSNEYYSLMLASCIFGGSPFSKLFNNVREKLSLAYYCISRVERFKSVMFISSGIETKNFKAAYDETMVQFNKMKNGEIDDAEFENSKRYLISSVNSMKDGLSAMEDYYLSQAILGKNGALDDLTAAIEKVTKEEVSAVFNKIAVDTVYLLKGTTNEEA